MTKQFYDEQCYVLVEQINNYAANDPARIAELSEERYTQQIRNACRNISENLSRSHIVLLAGPSASGKTITAHRFRAMLKQEFHINSFVVSLDDFYIDQDRLPTLPDGTKDLETVYALDIECIHRCFDELTRYSKASLPIFDFLQARRSDKTNEIVLGEHDILIVEGIHALNPIITEGLDRTKFFRLFISVQGEYRLNGSVVLNHTDIRFVRRCVRDFTHRASSLENTASMWASVRAGEKKYISPYKRFADFSIDSLILYEPCVLLQFLRPLIERMDNTSEYYPRFEKIRDVLGYFAEMSPEYVAKDSLLREFID